MKKSGEISVAVGATLVCLSLYYFLTKRNTKFVSENILTIDNYVNRLKEYDMSPEKEASNLFYDLLECGYSPQRAFYTVQKEIDEAGEIFK